MKHTSLLEKLGLALLIFGWLTYGSTYLGDVLVHAEDGDIDALRIVSDDSGVVAEEETEVAAVDFGMLLATADLASGAKTFKKCASCHNLTEGGGHKVGPNLWGVVGRLQGAAAGFNYSDAISGLGGIWTPEELFAFLESPRTYAPGNIMTFRGVGDPAKRAALIVFLGTHGG